MSDVTYDMRTNKTTILKAQAEPWKVTLIDTGLHSMTGERVRQIKKYVEKDPYFCLTYGDGVSNVNIKKLIQFHRSHKKIATLTAIQPKGRFGALNIEKK